MWYLMRYHDEHITRLTAHCVRARIEVRDIFTIVSQKDLETVEKELDEIENDEEETERWNDKCGKMPYFEEDWYELMRMRTVNRKRK